MGVTHGLTRISHRVGNVHGPASGYVPCCKPPRLKVCGKFTLFVSASMVPLRPWVAAWVIRRHQRTAMTIMILRGPHPTGNAFNGEHLRSLQQLAREAGRIVEVCACTGLRDFIAGLRVARTQTPEFVLLDPGEIAREAQAHPEAGLHDALDELTAPYIEVHDDSDTAIRSWTLSARRPPGDHHHQRRSIDKLPNCTGHRLAAAEHTSVLMKADKRPAQIRSGRVQPAAWPRANHQ